MHIRSIIGLFALTLLGLLLTPAVAIAVENPNPAEFEIPTLQIWTFVAGWLTPAITYVINKYAPWVSDPVKGIVHLITASIAAAIVVQVETGSIGFNVELLQACVTSIIAAFGAHAWFYKPTGIGEKLGAGQNA